MATRNSTSDASGLGRDLDSSLSQTAGMLDALSRSCRSLFGVRKDDAPCLVGAMSQQKDDLESDLIARMGELTASLPAIKSEMARCRQNLEVMRDRAEQLGIQETREKFEDAIRAQETQLQRASRHWPEVLDMICEIATGLQWSHGLPAKSPGLGVNGPAPLLGGGLPDPSAGVEIDGLMSMGSLTAETAAKATESNYSV